MMKKILLLLMVATAAIPASTQGNGQMIEEQGKRNLKLMVRNKRDKVMTDFPLLAMINGTDTAQSLDRFGNHFFKVSDTDTISLMVGEMIYMIPVAGKDSLKVIFNNRYKIDGITTKGRTMDSGYYTVSDKTNTSAMGAVDMTGSDVVHYRDLADFLDGRVAGLQIIGDRFVVRGFIDGALVVIDGVPRTTSLRAANAMVTPKEIESVTVLKDASAAIYGIQGANGVVVITTKTR